ncbi:HEAT repeat domain-containing protein [Ruminiclostridium herbifermentans]|uniref:HEAT repeat domain-containing protein n=1 Tax=Ruminiclostridium herbifermentans TaxID=2488810 RepID=A0A4U7JHF3_9FIRM|nr:HEAT repeat domain-containing protein [Ruminiclostridium herbifermentans]QNU66130.1 HEAT repeat domain-containing protein [Ruminiclostridium herbifermentans]
MEYINNSFDKQKVITLINNLIIKKERYEQEKLAKKLGNIKDERTPEFVAPLLYSKDAYIRNIAIEIFISLGEKSLKVLEQKLSDPDRNIRKFALDALKHIREKRSCEIAMTALDDTDENVVEAALEVIEEQSYKEAASKLANILEDTDSIWIINALIRTFDKLGLKKYSQVISEKIFYINVSDIEKNILMNTYVKALGNIGSYEDIDLIIYKYKKDFIIDDSNLVFGLCSLIVNNNISTLPENTYLELERIFKEGWNYKEETLFFISIAAFVQINMVFFLQDINEIYNFYKREEFFIENICNILQRLDQIPDSFINKLLSSEEPELVMLGLELENKKNIDYIDNTVCKEALEEITFGEKKDSMDPLDVDMLFLKLENKNSFVRKEAAQRLIMFQKLENVELIEEIINRNSGVEGMEALKVLFRLNSDIGLKHIAYRMGSMDENIRSGLIDIMEYSSDYDFYDFMNTMINDPSQKVRRKAIKALSKRIDDRSLQLLLKLYEDEYEEVNKMEIIFNIYKFKSESAFNLLSVAATSNAILIRIAAASSLGKYNSKKAEIVLQSMLSDPVEEVREAVREAFTGVEVME